jgi:hypothetical protein
VIVAVIIAVAVVAVVAIALGAVGSVSRELSNTPAPVVLDLIHEVDWIDPGTTADELADRFASES